MPKRRRRGRLAKPSGRRSRHTSEARSTECTFTARTEGSNRLCRSKSTLLPIRLSRLSRFRPRVASHLLHAPFIVIGHRRNRLQHRVRPPRSDQLLIYHPRRSISGDAWRHRAIHRPVRRAAARRAHVLVITSCSKFTLAFVPEATRVCDCYLKRKNHALVVIDRTKKGIVDRRKASRNPLLLLAKERTRRSRRRHKIEWKIENQNTRCAKFTKRTRSRRDAPDLLLRLPESTQLATSGLLLLLLSKPSDHPIRLLTKQTSNTSLLIGRGTESSRTTTRCASSSSPERRHTRRLLPERGLRDVLSAPESSSAAERHSRRLKEETTKAFFLSCVLFSNF